MRSSERSDVWFLGRLLAGFCIGLGLLAWAAWGDWSGVAIGLFVLGYAWLIRTGHITD